MRARLAGAAVGLMAAAVLTACGGSGDNTAGGSSTAAGSSGGQSQGTTVDVKATDFKLALSTTTFSPGTYTFKMANDGQSTHALALEGPGAGGKKSDTVGPGGTVTLTATLQAGKYTLYCPVDGHRAAGMETTFTVG